MKLQDIVNGARRLAKTAVEQVRGFMGKVHGLVDTARTFVAKLCEPVSRPLGMVRMSACHMLALVGLGAWVLSGTNARADGAPDVSTIVSTASTTFDTVGALVASAVGFFIIVKIVKWIRK